ncbi:hypothetical protein [Marinilabilia salmonicolor]|uniref:primosomal protein N' family DNA-binding protein n=1 Tax=Marinilabilia salmonicolor TaxID=989 RepID=UPI000AC91E4D|nr:hypothetical protein [Marinilabilia salmonicolor]
MSVPETFVDVILPVPLPRLFTYSVPSDMADIPEPGIRVVVPFGKKKQYSGIIFSVHKNKPKDYETKPILSVLESSPIVTAAQLNFWEWMAEYYQCTLGEVYKAALPSGLKLESETRVYYNPDYIQLDNLPEKTTKTLLFLSEKKVCTIQEINTFLGQKSSMPLLHKLMEEGAVFVSERLKENYKAKTENHLRISEVFRTETKLHEAFNLLEKAPRQLNLLMTLIQKTGGAGNALKGKSIARKDLLEENSSATAALNELIKKEIFEQFSREVGRWIVQKMKYNKKTPSLQPSKKLTKRSKNPLIIKLLSFFTGSPPAEKQKSIFTSLKNT